MDKEIVMRQQRGLQSRLEHMPWIIDKIRYRRKPLSLANCYSSLGDDHVSIAVSSYFIEGDVKSFKQNLHVATLLKISAVHAQDYQRFMVGTEVFYALLSDNPVLIDTVSRMKPAYFTETRGNPLHYAFLVHMYQLAILGEYELLQSKVERLAKNGRKKDRKLPAQGKDFFSLLMQADKQGLEDLIAQRALVKGNDALTEDFMCFEGTIEAKICWLKGIKVQVDSDLLPMALMPHEPLNNYDDVYDFLAPGYVPPKVSWLERVRYRLRERAASKELTRRALEASQRV
jgi:hypothetical protein